MNKQSFSSCSPFLSFPLLQAFSKNLSPPKTGAEEIKNTLHCHCTVAFQIIMCFDVCKIHSHSHTRYIVNSQVCFFSRNSKLYQISMQYFQTTIYLYTITSFFYSYFLRMIAFFHCFFSISELWNWKLALLCQILVGLYLLRGT